MAQRKKKLGGLSMLNEHLFDSREALNEAVTAFCEATLDKAVKDNGKTTFLVSGGSTPAPLYQALSESALPWQDIHVAPVDERWVDEDHKASNAAFVKRSLLQGKATQAPFTPMKTASVTANEGAAEVAQRYGELPDNWDLLVLGMGPDGHTASLFPHGEGTAAALDAAADANIAAIMAKPSKVTGDNLERISLSLAGIMQAKQIVLLITGEEKLAVLREAMGEVDAQDLPIAAVLKQDKVPVHLFWAP